MSIAHKMTAIAENMPRIYKKGQDSFWDKYQDNGNRLKYDYAFAGNGWTDEIFSPRYPINAQKIQKMFYNSNITSTKVPIDLTNMIAEDSADTMFSQCPSLKEIPSLTIGRNTVFAGSFDYSYELEKIGFKGELWSEISLAESEKLTDETLIQLVHIAKDFLHDDDESVQAMAFNFSMYFCSGSERDVVNYIWELKMDERSPEYCGMTLGDVLIEKGWSC